MSTQSPSHGEDVFISYCHDDNLPFGPHDRRWISYLHEELKNRLPQWSPIDIKIWRDDGLHGNDIFPETLAIQVANVTVMVSVCTPRYLDSAWCLRELELFLASERDVPTESGPKSRLFKVLKTAVELDDLPDPLKDLLGYQFYEGERSLDYLLYPDEEHQLLFYLRVEELAQDIGALLRQLHGDKGASPKMGTVYLATCTSDVAPKRDEVKRELRRRGYEVLPQMAFRQEVNDLIAAVDRDLARSQLSVHMLGERYGARPEGDERSTPHLELVRAAEAAAQGRLAPMVWIPDDLTPSERQEASLVADLLAGEPASVEVVRAPLETFKENLLERLDSQHARPPDVPAPDGGERVYLVYDLADRAAVRALRTELESLGHVVLLPLGDGTAAQARKVHKESMVHCDAVIVYYGTATEFWVRMKLFDLVKAAGWGRKVPFRAAAVWIDAPVTPSKEEYISDEAMVIRATQQPVRVALKPFLDRLAGSAARR